jgi:hypothetical protein
MAKQRLMNANDAKRMLAMLFDELQVQPSSTVVEGDPTAFIGTYIDDDDVAVSLVACDRAFCAALGAAMTLVPPDAAKEAAATGDFPEAILANVREIMNILSRLYMEGSSPHLRFAELKTLSQLNEAEQNVMNNVADRLDMTMTIPTYGGGNLSLITL